MTTDNREKLIMAVRDASATSLPFGEVLSDLALHLESTAGEFSDKALAEIAYAYLVGREDGAYPHTADVRAAKRALVPMIPAINRVS